MSMQSRAGGGSRASDEDTKTAVKVGEYTAFDPRFVAQPVQFVSLIIGRLHS